MNSLLFYFPYNLIKVSHFAWLTKQTQFVFCNKVMGVGEMIQWERAFSVQIRGPGSRHLAAAPCAYSTCTG